MEQNLAAALWKVVRATEKTDHIPPITTNEANPFPYQVYIILTYFITEDYYSCVTNANGNGGRGLGSCT